MVSARGLLSGRSIARPAGAPGGMRGCGCGAGCLASGTCRQSRARPVTERAQQACPRLLRDVFLTDSQSAGGGLDLLDVPRAAVAEVGVLFEQGGLIGW